MLGHKKYFFIVLVLVLFFSIPLTANAEVLMKGMSSYEVKTLQQDLKDLGYFNASCTGYYGNITYYSVKNLQRDYGLWQDGIAGPFTLNLINDLLEPEVLKLGMRSSSIISLQEDLKSLGYFNASCTGYYGSITYNAVASFQRDNNLLVDGIAGKNTRSLIDSRLSCSVMSNSSYMNNNYSLPWFGTVEYIFKRGDKAVIYDIKSKMSFNIMRTYGYNHADCETLTSDDTKIMKQIYGGYFSWERRSVIVYVNGYAIAASMAGMPHAGRDDKPANIYVYNRSEGYGYGSNLDTVKNNSMDGVFDLHFLLSKTHATNRVEPRHQQAVKTAAEWALNNLK